MYTQGHKFMLFMQIRAMIESKPLLSSVMALGTTYGLSLGAIFQLLEGVLPTISLLISTVATITIIWWNVGNSVRARRKDRLETERLTIELAELRRKVERDEAARIFEQHNRLP